MVIRQTMAWAMARNAKFLKNSQFWETASTDLQKDEELPNWNEENENFKVSYQFKIYFQVYSHN